MYVSLKVDNVRVIPDAGDVETVGADTIAKLSAQTSEPRSVAAWDQRIVIRRVGRTISIQCSIVVDPQIVCRYCRVRRNLLHEIE